MTIQIFWWSVAGVSGILVALMVVSIYLDHRQFIQYLNDVERYAQWEFDCLLVGRDEHRGRKPWGKHYIFSDDQYTAFRRRGRAEKFFTLRERLRLGITKPEPTRLYYGGKYYPLTKRFFAYNRCDWKQRSTFPQEIPYRR